LKLDIQHVEEIVQQLKILNQVNTTINLSTTFESEFLTYTQHTNKHISKCIIYLLSKYIEEINKNVNIDDAKIFFNISDSSINIFQEFYLTNLKLRNKYEIITHKNNIIGLEDEIINNMLFSYEFYRKKVSDQRFSAKIYYDQKFDDYSIKNNILILLGIISTNFVGKLGNE
jgi:hypothetical protein